MKFNSTIMQWLYKIDQSSVSAPVQLIDGKYKPHLNDALARFIMIAFSKDKNSDVYKGRTTCLELDISFIIKEKGEEKTAGSIYTQEGDVNLRTEIVAVNSLVKQFNIAILNKRNEVEKVFRHLPKQNKPGLSLLDLTKAIHQDLNGVFLR